MHVIENFIQHLRQVQNVVEINSSQWTVDGANASLTAAGVACLSLAHAT